MATAVAASGGRDYEHAEIRFDPGGGVVLMTGSMDHGQGHGTTFKQVLSEKLGIDADLDPLPLWRQRSRDDGHRDLRLALGPARRLGDRRRRRPAHRQGPQDRRTYDGGRSRDDVVFENGRFTIAGTDRVGRHRRRRQALFRICAAARAISRPAFTDRANFGPPDCATFPSGRAFLRARNRRGNGGLALTRYVAVDDVGRVLNPLLCEGQIHGGIVQGIGQALIEDLVYDQSTRPAADRLVPGLLHAARRRFLCFRAGRIRP